ncbi:hypothetical protein GA0115247_12026 [Streptomyces sp. PalvLS-984]|nr:hypothetical protein GA0115247_12026 [Streptomyces sp. PalvLS-984]
MATPARPGRAPSRAATRRGTGPGAAKWASVAAGAPLESSAALPMARATTRRFPVAAAASSSAHRSAVYATAVRSGRRNGLARAASRTVSRNRWWEPARWARSWANNARRSAGSRQSSSDVEATIRPRPPGSA